jgi:hypothetical protein
MEIEKLAIDEVSGLAGGLLGDLEQLVQQQIELSKAELREGLDTARNAIQRLATGIAVLLIGILPLPFFLAEVLRALSNYKLPLWVAYGAISLPLICVGLWMLRSARAGPVQSERSSQIQ